MSHLKSCGIRSPLLIIVCFEIACWVSSVQCFSVSPISFGRRISGRCLRSQKLVGTQIVPVRARGTDLVRFIRMDISITLPSPLGIVFEEVEPGESRGVVVANLLPGGNADLDGRILVGDKLLAVSAVVLDSSQKPLLGIGGGVQNTNWKRQMIPTGSLDFETIMNAIRSNSGRYGYRDVRLTFRRTDKSVPRSTETLRRLREQSATREEDKPDLPVKTAKDQWQD